MLRLHSKIDNDILEAAMTVLKVFKDVTTMMSSQTTATASLVKPLLHQLMQISKPMEGDERAIHQAKATLYHDLEKRFVEYWGLIFDHK